MKKVIAAVLVLALSSPLVGFAADHSNLAKSMVQSVVSIAIGEGGQCTGFVIDNERDFVLTAAHCDQKGQELYVDLAPAKIRAKDTKNDLMVLFVEGIDKPALKLAKANPAVGEEVASYGWGYALNVPLFRVAVVSAIGLELPGAGIDFIALDAPLVPGQSGGPVVNAKGEVSMIVQMTSESTGFGKGAEQIAKSVGRYFTGGK